MPHIAEALLHEYLDRQERPGPDADASSSRHVEAHLATCDACRVKLDEVRELRRRASGVLAHSGPPSIARPSFDSLVARSRVQQKRRRVVTLNRLTALGWAATIVLAVGVGWIARGTLSLGEGGPLEPVGSSPAGAVTEREADEAPRGVGSVAARSQAEPDVPASALAREAPAPSPPGRGATPAGEPQPEAKAAADPLEQALPRNVTERRDVPAEEAPAAPAPAVVDELQKPAAPVVAEAAGGVRREAAALERAREDFRAARAQEGDALAVRQFEQSLDSVSWRETDRAEAERRLGGRLRLVEDLSVLRISLGTVTGAEAVRTEQSLLPGDTLVLIQWKQAEALAMELANNLQLLGAVAVTDRQSIAETRDGYVLLLRARATADSLRALLRRIP